MTMKHDSLENLELECRSVAPDRLDQWCMWGKRKVLDFDLATSAAADTFILNIPL